MVYYIVQMSFDFRAFEQNVLSNKTRRRVEIPWMEEALLPQEYST
jgi:hypothetical protein